MPETHRTSGGQLGQTKVLCTVQVGYLTVQTRVSSGHLDADYIISSSNGPHLNVTSFCSLHSPLFFFRRVVRSYMLRFYPCFPPPFYIRSFYVSSLMSNSSHPQALLSWCKPRL